MCNLSDKTYIQQIIMYTDNNYCTTLIHRYCAPHIIDAWIYCYMQKKNGDATSCMKSGVALKKYNVYLYYLSSGMQNSGEFPEDDGAWFSCD